MKARMAGLVAAGVMVATLVAHAGTKWTYPVVIYKYADGSGVMFGTLGSTRNADTPAWFGCYYQNFTAADGSYKYGMCYAFDGTMVLSCGTTDPALTDTISRVTGDAYLYVVADGAGNCTRVQIGVLSQTAPKEP